jgi:hypothetical protein
MNVEIPQWASALHLLTSICAQEEPTMGDHTLSRPQLRTAGRRPRARAGLARRA